jgi:hypothetical protein
MLAPPHNIKQPKEALLYSDYRRDEQGNVFAVDGTKLKVDKNHNFIRDEQKSYIALDGTIIPVHTDGENKGKTIDPNKSPISETKQRSLGGFPLYKDGVLMGWNEYRNTKMPIYFMRKDRGRHHYIIGKS